MSTLHFLFFKTGPRHTRTLREAAAYLCKQPRCFIDLRDNEGETPLLVACLRKECGFHIDRVKRVKLTAVIEQRVHDGELEVILQQKNQPKKGDYNEQH